MINKYTFPKSKFEGWPELDSYILHHLNLFKMIPAINNEKYCPISLGTMVSYLTIQPAWSNRSFSSEDYIVLSLGEYKNMNGFSI